LSQLYCSYFSGTFSTFLFHPELYNGVGGELPVKKLDLSYMGPVFKQARLDANMTQDELAERVGITSRFLQAIESNERGVSLDTLIRIIRALGISADTCRKKKTKRNCIFS